MDSGEAVRWRPQGGTNIGKGSIREGLGENTRGQWDSGVELVGSIPGNLSGGGPRMEGITERIGRPSRRHRGWTRQGESAERLVWRIQGKKQSSKGLWTEWITVRSLEGKTRE